jgi:hypothetical protein
LAFSLTSWQFVRQQLLLPVRLKSLAEVIDAVKEFF